MFNPLQLPGLNTPQGRAVLVGLGVGVALVIALPLLRRNAAGIGKATGGAVFDFADGAAGEIVNSAGDVLGIPRTNKTQCEADMAAGRWWDASFSCPAGDFIGGLFK